MAFWALREVPESPSATSCAAQIVQPKSAQICAPESVRLNGSSLGLLGPGGTAGAGGGGLMRSTEVRLRNTAAHASGEVALIAVRACQPPEGASSAVESGASSSEGAAGYSRGSRTRVDYNAA